MFSKAERAAGPALFSRLSPLKSLAAIACLLAGTLGMAGAASAQSLPIQHNFDAPYAASLVQVSAGCTHSYVASGGWRGGAIKFTPPTTAEGSCGLWPFVTGSLPVPAPEQVNVRFLIYHGSSWQEYGPNNKLVILNRANNGGRPMIITQDNTDGTAPFETLGVCDGTVCKYDSNEGYARGNERLRIGNSPFAREHQWISVELEANTRTGMIRLYVDTQDGTLRGLYSERYMDDTGPGGTWTFGCVGCYMAQATRSDPENYFMIDEVVTNSRYIGPPAGFAGGVQPRPPTNVSVQ
jgi:hypothetical protein